jgi:hypothetical protein
MSRFDAIIIGEVAYPTNTSLLALAHLPEGCRLQDGTEAASSSARKPSP